MLQVSTPSGSVHLLAAQKCPLWAGASSEWLPMLVVRDRVDGPQVDFEAVLGVPTSWAAAADGGTVRVAGVSPLTGASGVGVWGAAQVLGSSDATLAMGWAMYR